MADLNKQFDEAMFAIYRQAKEEIKYNASFFLQMLDRYKGQVTAKQLINSSKPSDGFTTLWERGRLDLTVEALIVDNPRWRKLFTNEEIVKARKRLEAYGYKPRN